jgi:aminoglycoside phosphotransferase (APT) family kinase protein
MRAKRTTLLRAAKAPTKGARRRPKTHAREAKGKMQSSTPSEFDAARLEGFLRARVNGAHGAYFHLERISGGQSNPTYFVTIGNRLLVMRKKPAGATLRSAHAIDREYRVLKALAETDVPVPRVALYCDDDSVVGTPFYVMDRLEGRIFADAALPGVSPAERETMYFSMAETLAKLHDIDPVVVGLSDYGAIGNYFARQINRWTKQYHGARWRDLPDVERLIEWLPSHVPPEDETRISHGDFRMGNLCFHPTEPRVIGVLDWELSTLGEPLADLAYSALGQITEPQEFGGLRGLNLAALGIPTRPRYFERYFVSRKTPSRAPLRPFHTVFALFRLAVIFEGIAARARTGSAASADAAEVGELSAVFARRAMECVEGDTDSPGLRES